MQSLRALFRTAELPTGAIAVAALCLLLETAASLATPWIGGRFGERILTGGPGDTETYQHLLTFWLGLMLLQQGLRFIGSYRMGSAGAAVTARLRNRIYDHLQALPLSYHSTRNRGDTLTLLSRDAGIVGQFLTTTLPSLAPQVILLFGAWAMMLAMSLPLGMLIGLAVPLVVLGFKVLWRRIRPTAARLADAHADHLGAVEENLRLLNILKAFGREPLESARLERHNDRILHLERRHMLLLSAIGPLVQGAGAVLLILVLWLGAGQLNQGNLAPGEAISLLLYGLLLFRPASQLASMFGGLHSTLGAAERIKHALASETELLREGRDVPPPNAGAIRIEDLQFSYPNRDELFGGLSCEIHPGEIVAVTGANGAGKTTLVNLLMRFMDPSQGRILLDGVDIRELRLDALRGMIGLVPQQVVLLNGSIRDNIAYGLPDASETAIRQAAEAAQASTFIDALPEGMDTLVGPEGLRLSGGQRQRIALARALLRNCPILVLDEATSLFDREGERAFAEAYRRQAGRRTVLVISHRPESLAMADRRLELGARAGTSPALIPRAD